MEYDQNPEKEKEGDKNLEYDPDEESYELGNDGDKNQNDRYDDDEIYELDEVETKELEVSDNTSTPNSG